MQKITGHTKLLCLIGSPVEHSKSPEIHNAAAEILGLDYVYTAFDTDKDNIEDAARGLALLGAKGFNVTMPGKTILADISDTLSDAASLSHSVNTVVIKDGKLCGHSTDGSGYMSSLKAEGINIIGEKITLLGTGGAAKSIIVQAALDKVKEIDVYRRRSKEWEPSVEFCNRISAETGCKINVCDIDDKTALKNSISNSRVLTNATNVGMAPNTSDCLIPDSSYLCDSLAVYDIIYNPAQTTLLKMAEEKGLKTINGLPMLLYQAADAFKLFTGYDMPVEEVKKRVKI
ncbi:MAG: shikimate dehydrogenase [Eubacterium sp.]|nr:shikimate dehydrogenase [Eubacterium sp.]